MENDLREPGMKVLEKLADALGLKTLDRLTGRDQEPLGFDSQLDSPAKVINVYAGGVAHAGAENVWQVLEGRTVFVSEDIAPYGFIVAVEVVGTCMEPDLLEGDIVFVDRSRRNAELGEMVLVTVPEMGLLVKLVAERRGTGTLVLTSNDGEVLEPDEATIEGVVVANHRRAKLQPRFVD